MHLNRSSGLTVAIVSALTRAAHGDPLAVETTGELPFSKAELGAALSLRAALATATSPRKVLAQVAGDADSIRIEVMGRERKVALDGQRGVDAARLVAFAILDLAGDDLDPPKGPESERASERWRAGTTSGTTARTIAAETATAHLTRVGQPPPSHAAAAWSIAAWGIGGTRTEAILEGAAPLTQRLRFVAAAGASAAMTDQSVTLRSFPARLSLAVGIPTTPIELRVGAIAVIEHASADRAETDLRLGAGAAAVWHARITARFSLLFGAGGDGFATAFDYRVNGMPIVTTERLAWWAGAAVAWEPAR